MAKKLVITLDEETMKKYLDMASEKTEAEVNEDCEPSGPSLLIDIAPGPYEADVYFEGKVEIGEAKVDLVDS